MFPHAPQLGAQARKLRSEKKIAQQDADALRVLAELQATTRALLCARYGGCDAAGTQVVPYAVELELAFPATMPDFAARGAGPERLRVELAPIALMPHAVHTFLEAMRGWKGGVFHRRAGHVLQAQLSARTHGLAFQEYSPEFPHVKGTLGFAGRPGGPAFYISTLDNTRNHGPGSQNSATEADSCFGKLADKESEAVVERMKLQPGAKPPNGFVFPSENYIQIKSVKILTPAME
jgi:hypothetical protein